MRIVSQLKLLKLGRLLIVLALMLGVVGVTFAPIELQAAISSDHGLLVELDGEIDTIATSRVERGLEQAVDDGYSLIVIRVDTPNGTLGVPRNIVRLIVDSPIPVITYIAENSRAGGAGTFVAAAGHLLVMSPKSSIGAAASSRNFLSDESYSTLDKKNRESAAALLRSIAELRTRNIGALENTIENDASYSANEALELGIADFMVDSVDELLTVVNGQEVMVDGSKLTIRSYVVELVVLQSSFFERVIKAYISLIAAFVNFIKYVGVAYGLIVLGIVTLIVALFFHRFQRRNVGTILATGLIMIVTGGFSLIPLIFPWLGTVLLVFAFGILTVENWTSSFGILGIEAIISFVLGIIFLSSIVPISPQLIVVAEIVLLMAIIFATVMLLRLAIRMLRKKDNMDQTSPSSPDAGQ